MYRIENIKPDEGYFTFDVYKNNEFLSSFKIKIPGRHNILNATASIALAVEEQVPLNFISEAISSFEGVHRRFEYMGEYKGALVYNDYAHHPTEVAATLQGFREAFPDRRLIVVFQPHLFSRTRDHHDSFGTAFGNCDVLFGCDIYPAREKPIEGVTGELVVQSALNRGHRDARYIGVKENALSALKRELTDKDIVAFMGAGNVWLLGKELLEDKI